MPKMIAAVRRMLGGGDPGGPGTAAHPLKGSLRSFCVDAVLRSERMARDGRFV
ncbi:MAG: hypothetical protein GXY25_17350 [Pirellulaceae bacterium]|nr:hypothetical protein [Pirellulaceae bacterium]